MNTRKAYKAIELIIEEYFFANKQNINEEELGVLATFASSMSLSDDDNSTLDPAFWNDWIKSIESDKKEELLEQEGYKAALLFLNYYASLMNSSQIGNIAKNLTWQKWLEALKLVSN